MTDPVKIIVGEGSITEVNVPEYNLIQTGGGGGGSGSDGATFFPEVSEEGVISWTNDGGYDNPEPVNIKGPAGNDGNDGNDGEDGTTFTPAVDASGNLSWTNDGGKQNPQTVNIKGPAGNDGNDGEDGEDGVSPTVTFTTITGGHTMTVTDKDHPSGQSINIMDGSGGSGTSDYDDLTDKPSINGTTLSGNKTAEELGLGTYSKPSGGIPKTDLESAVKTSLGKADSALQSVPSTYRTATAQDAIDAAQDAEIDEIQATEVIVVNIASYSGSQVRVPASGTNDAITANHVLLATTIGTPTKQTGGWTVTTYDGYLTLSGTASGATTVQLILGKAGTTI